MPVVDRFLRLALVGVALWAGVGCRAWQSGAPVRHESLLRPALSPDSMQLDVFFVRFPPGDEELTDSMWHQIDEQQLPPTVRRELSDNGIRVGIVGGELPAPLARLMASAQRPANPLEAAASLERAPTVSRQILQLHSGWRGEIFTSGVWPSMPLLFREQGHVRGQTYSSAQGVLNTRAWADGDRMVKLQITPELEYGEARQQWISEDGVLRAQPAKPKRTFDRLQFEATLAPSQVLLLTSLPERSGTVGHFFFTEPDGGRQQKLVVVRLARSGGSDLFTPALVDDQPADAGIVSK